MIIKVCGMREPENIRAVNDLGVDLIGMIFYKESPRFVSLVNSHAGIIPDRVDETAKESLESTNAKFVGVFVDEMPQTVVTNVYNFNLDYVQLHGDESPIYIDNLRLTLDPDIRPGIKIIKAISVGSADDLQKTSEYEGHADMFLFDTRCPSKGGSGKQFDWEVLKEYKGNTPFLLSGGIGPDDAEQVKAFSHPMCVGIDLNSKFEIEPALKDVDKIKSFIEKIK